MKNKCKIWIAVFMINTLISIAPAYCQLNSPRESWVNISEGIALSLVLKERFIVVNIKNNSSDPKNILSQGPNLFVRIFYIDDSGAQKPLGYDSRPDDIIQRNKSFDIILPGAVQSTKIALTSNEFALIKTHPVICRILVFDPIAKKKSIIESSPIMVQPS